MTDVENSEITPHMEEFHISPEHKNTDVEKYDIHPVFFNNLFCWDLRFSKQNQFCRIFDVDTNLAKNCVSGKNYKYVMPPSD